MKRYRVFSILSATVLMTATAYAQTTTASGQQQLTAAGIQVSQTSQPGQRSGGPGQRGAGGQSAGGFGGAAPMVANRILEVGAPAAWWTDTALMTRLGLSDVQKARIENIFQTHRQNLTTTKDAL